MLPKKIFEKNINSGTAPSKTFFLDISANKISGFIDGKDALLQTIYLIFSTRRFEYPIYSNSYGNDISTLKGVSKPLFESEAKRLVSEALLVDDRIKSVDNFKFSYDEKRANISFCVKSIFGDISYTDIV